MLRRPTQELIQMQWWSMRATHLRQQWVGRPAGAGRGRIGGRGGGDEESTGQGGRGCGRSETWQELVPPAWHRRATQLSRPHTTSHPPTRPLAPTCRRRGNAWSVRGTARRTSSTPLPRIAAEGVQKNDSSKMLAGAQLQRHCTCHSHWGLQPQEASCPGPPAAHPRRQLPAPPQQHAPAAPGRRKGTELRAPPRWRR